MLISLSKLIDKPILSIDVGGPVARLGQPIVDPDSLQVIGFFVENSPAGRDNHILDIRSIREYSRFGVVIDNGDEFLTESDVIRIRDVLSLHFTPFNLKVETKKRTNLGKTTDFFFDSEDYHVRQLVVKRPLLKSFNDSELVIPRSEVVEVTDTKIIVKDEERVIHERAMQEDFIPNFVNPFRNQEPDFAPTRTQTPDDTNN